MAFLAVFTALAALAADVSPITLSNELVSATIDPRVGLLSLADTAGQAAQRVLAISNDSWSVAVADSATVAVRGRAASRTEPIRKGPPCLYLTHI